MAQRYILWVDAMDEEQSNNKVLCDEIIALRTAMTSMHEAVANGVVHGMQRVANDPKFVEEFWAAGYKQLAQRSSDNAARWIGRRILTATAILALTVILGYLIRTGTIK